MIRIMKFILISGLFIWFSFWWNININDISIRFCSEDSNKLDKRVSIYNKAWEKSEECIVIINKSNNTWYIDLHFVSQTQTNQWEKACGLPWSPEDAFVKYIKTSRSGLIFVGEKIEEKKRFETDFPVGMQGVQWWCLAFFVADKYKVTTNVEWTLLSMITRKASLFEIWVDDEKDFLNKIEFERLGKSRKIFFFWNGFKSQILFDNIDKSLNLRMGIKNMWNVGQKINLSWKLYSILGYRKEIEVKGKILERNKSLILDTKWINPSIPEYHWLFRFHLNLEKSPYFAFDSSRIPKEKLLWSVETTNIIFFIISWISIGFLVLLILAIFMIYRIFKKKVIIKK